MRVPQRWIEYDRHLSAQIIARARHPLVRGLFFVTAHSGDGLVWLLIGLLLWTWQRVASRGIALRILVTVLVTSTLSAALKQLFRRQRPKAPARGFYNTFDRYGFPSGHAVRVGALSVILGGRMPAPAMPTLIMWSIAVCLSRIALRVHFVSDVGVGLALGWITGLLLRMSGV